MYRCGLLQIDDHIHTFGTHKSQPTTITVGPVATQTVGERLLAVGGVLLPVAGIELDGLVFGQMVDGLTRLGSAAYLLTQVEGVVASRQHTVGFSILHTAAEVTPRLVFRLCPSYFGQGDGAGVEHVFQVLFGGNVFRPYVGLHAQHQGAVMGRVEGVGQGVVAINLFGRKVSAHGFGLHGGSILVGVEVAKFTWAHDDLMAALHGSSATLFAAP